MPIYTQNEVAWEFDFLQTNGFEDMPIEKWFNFSQIHMPILHRYHFGIGIIWPSSNYYLLK